MRIGIDCSCWHNPRGFGRFTRGLVAAMLASPSAHTFTCFVDGATPPELAHAGIEVVCVSPAAISDARRPPGTRGVGDIARFTRATFAHPTDVFLFPAVYSWFPLPPARRCVLTVHDAIAEQFSKLVFPQRRDRMLWGLKMRLALWQATRVLAVSAAARDDIVRVLGVARERVDLTTEGVDPIFRRIDEHAALERERVAVGIPPNASYLLYVGGLAPHKNLIRCLQGFARALDTTGADDLYLVLVGDPDGGGFHSCAAEIRQFVAANARLRERVLFAGFVEDARLPALYSAALACLMPALLEGFGLPALEAMACGTPVLASRSGAVPGVVGDAGVLFDPMDAQSIGSAIVRVATSPALVQQLRDRTGARVTQHSWTRAAALAIASLTAARAAH